MTINTICIPFLFFFCSVPLSLLLSISIAGRYTHAHLFLNWFLPAVPPPHRVIAARVSNHDRLLCTLHFEAKNGSKKSSSCTYVETFKKILHQFLFYCQLGSQTTTPYGRALESMKEERADEVQQSGVGHSYSLRFFL